MTPIDEQRSALVAEALGWIGTPYVSNGRVKGRAGGADCLTFIAGAFEDAGQILPLAIPAYAPDWHLNQTEELYLQGVRDHCVEVSPPPARLPLPGDIVMWKFGHCFSHAAIVVKWPIVVHAYCRRPIGRDDADRTSILSTIHETRALRGQPRPRKFFSLKSWV